MVISATICQAKSCRPEYPFRSFRARLALWLRAISDVSTVTQTGFISSPVLAETEEWKHSPSPPGLAALILLTFTRRPHAVTQRHRPAQSFRLLLFLLHCCRHRLNLPLFLTFNLCQHELILFIVFLHPKFFFLSRLQGDHGPEGKMHGLSHGDVRFCTAGGGDHRPGSGGQVSKKNTALSSLLKRKAFNNPQKQMKSINLPKIHFLGFNMPFLAVCAQKSSPQISVLLIVG